MLCYNLGTMKYIKEILELITENPTLKNWVHIVLFILFLYVASLFLYVASLFF